MPTLKETGKKRKISLFGVARSIISQLSFGQDLTSIGLPSVFLQPFSLLELAASRKLGYFDILSSFNEVDTDLERIVLVLRWLLTYVSDDHPDKKPYNPVIGETHVCSIESENNGKTKFYSEQLSHHPPVSAFYLKNKEKKISIEGNINFGVRFETNSVMCTTEGFLNVQSQDPKLEGEIYRVDKGLPDLQINNVILGTRTMGWTGIINITCDKNGLSIPIKFHKSKNRVLVEGKILRNEEELYGFEGYWMEEPLYAYPISEPNNKSIMIFDMDSVEKSKINYPEPFQVPDLNTFKVWGTVTESIVQNDMNTADIEKKRIEAEQRRRIKQWNNDNFMFFSFDEESQKWVFNKKKGNEHHTAS